MSEIRARMPIPTWFVSVGQVLTVNENIIRLLREKHVLREEVYRELVQSRSRNATILLREVLDNETDPEMPRLQEALEEDGQWRALEELRNSQPYTGRKSPCTDMESRPPEPCPRESSMIMKSFPHQAAPGRLPQHSPGTNRRPKVLPKPSKPQGLSQSSESRGQETKNKPSPNMRPRQSVLPQPPSPTGLLESQTIGRNLPPRQAHNEAAWCEYVVHPSQEAKTSPCTQRSRSTSNSSQTCNHSPSSPRRPRQATPPAPMSRPAKSSANSSPQAIHSPRLPSAKTTNIYDTPHNSPHRVDLIVNREKSFSQIPLDLLLDISLHFQSQMKCEWLAVRLGLEGGVAVVKRSQAFDKAKDVRGVAFDVLQQWLAEKGEEATGDVLYNCLDVIEMRDVAARFKDKLLYPEDEPMSDDAIFLLTQHVQANPHLFPRAKLFRLLNTFNKVNARASGLLKLAAFGKEANSLHEILLAILAVWIGRHDLSSKTLERALDDSGCEELADFVAYQRLKGETEYYSKTQMSGGDREDASSAMTSTFYASTDVVETPIKTQRLRRRNDDDVYENNVAPAHGIVSRTEFIDEEDIYEPMMYTAANETRRNRPHVKETRSTGDSDSGCVTSS